MKHLLRILWLAAFVVAGGFWGARAASNYENYTFTTFAGFPEAGAGSADGSNSVARFSSPSGVTVDGAGNVFVADTGNHTLRKILPTGQVATVAGLAGSSGSADGTGGGAQFHYPQKAAADSAGNLYVVDSDNHILRKVTPAGVVTTLAGGVGVAGTNDGPGTQARFNSPLGIAVDGTGSVYVADTYNHSIRKVTPGGVVITLAGTPSVSGTNNGVGTTAKFYYPCGVAVSTNGTVYVADFYNHVIRKITAAGAVTTFAGKMSTSGSANGTSTTARFNNPFGLAVGSGGTLYVVDYGNSMIRKITSAGTVSTLAGTAGSSGSTNGTGSAALFDQPFDVAADLNSGLVYVADSGNHLIRKITSAGVVTTPAGQVVSSGTNNGTGGTVRFNMPTGAALDVNGNMYISDYGNQVVRKISPAGVVTSLAGMAGVTGTNNGTGTAARFNGPAGVAVDGSGNVYVAEYKNHAIRKITPGGMVTTLAGRPGTYGTNNGTGTAARFTNPIGVAVDTSGTVYVGDLGNSAIRKITPLGVVTTLAGLVGTSGTNDGVGVAARFNQPEGVAVDGSNYVYVADAGNNCIRKVAPDGTVTTLAGLSGTSGSDDGTNSTARFYSPFGIAVDSEGNLFIGDTGNQVIRKITPDGVVTTIGGQVGTSGSADGSGSMARFNSVAGVAVDSNGFVYVTDSGNHTIRKGNPALSDYPVVDVPIASIGNVRHLDVTNMTTTSWSWSIVRYPATGTAQLSATTVHDPTFNPDATNDFFVIRFQGWDAQGRTAIGTVSVGDDMRPQVIIVSPAWDEQINNRAYTVTGTATDDFEVTGVQVQINDGPWLPASGLTNWTSQVTFIEGVNTIRAYAEDNRGQFSATNSVSVVLSRPWLTIMPTETNSLVVSWPLPANGWVLEWTNHVPIVSNTWPRISPPYQTNAVQAWIVVPAPTGSVFYRLHKP
jgi:streptogramin lyase